MADRSRSSGRWVGRAFLVAWLAGALYTGLSAAHDLYGVPSGPALGVAGALLMSIFLGGFAAFIAGCGYYQVRGSPAGRWPVTWRGELVGWVAAPAPRGPGDPGCGWRAADSPAAAEFLAALRRAPEGGLQVLVGGLPGRIEPRPDEAGQTRVWWHMNRHTAEPGAAADRAGGSR